MEYESRGRIVVQEYTGNATVSEMDNKEKRVPGIRLGKPIKSFGLVEKLDIAWM